ncbi:MAG: hypothetical protein R3C61_22990 [Bacteroidia bacterium]
MSEIAIANTLIRKGRTVIRNRASSPASPIAGKKVKKSRQENNQKNIRKMSSWFTNDFPSVK